METNKKSFDDSYNELCERYGRETVAFAQMYSFHRAMTEITKAYHDRRKQDESLAERVNRALKEGS